MNEIKVNMKKYCESCDFFEPVITKKTQVNDFVFCNCQRMDISNSKVYISECKYRGICDRIETMLVKEVKEKSGKCEECRKTMQQVLNDYCAIFENGFGTLGDFCNRPEVKIPVKTVEK